MLVKFVPMMMLFIVEPLNLTSHELSIVPVKSLPAVTKVTVFI